MAPRRRYTQTQRAEAVGLAEVIGIRPAADATGIPESSIRRFREQPDMAQLRAEKHEDVALDVFAAFQKGVHRIAELLPDTDDIGKVAVATGVMFDKYALMTGQATSRSESRTLTEDMNDDERQRLRDWIDSLPASALAAESAPG